MPPRHGESLLDAEIEEREIDQTLADSFPASDAPSWTMGVKESPHRRPQTGSLDSRRGARSRTS